ncbi:MAG: hypothetical protein NVS3B10_09010 [Polyangiales bacterium]
MLDEAPGTSGAGEGSGGGGAAVIIGVILLLGAAVAILWFVVRKPAETKQVTTVETVSAAPTDPTIDLPSIDPVVDSGADTGEDTGADAGKKVAGGGGCTSTCGGNVTDALKQAVAARAGTAKQCYKTALEGNEGLAGDMSILVRVGTDGQPCSVNVTSDTTGSNRLQQCVRSKMVASYPQPKGGCVDVRVPISFKPKT